MNRERVCLALYTLEGMEDRRRVVVGGRGLEFGGGGGVGVQESEGKWGPKTGPESVRLEPGRLRTGGRQYKNKGELERRSRG